ncbi:MAG: adenylate/guanylate cyclase domain-containing protein [Mycobacteriales bacterium]
MQCPACQATNPDQAKFCLECGSSLLDAGRPLGEERKVVSVLFCDLVGFTAASEFADPEDVRARLVPYHRMLAERIESFGGTVEKFIGDAVMAVFGAPVAHEDDAERAVRAGLRILTAMEELNGSSAANLSVRIGVNTGEAVVTLGARPEAGEGFVTGDVVNTAARIQTSAPIDAVAVGEATYHATSQVFAYEPLEPVSVKGKSAPLTLWRAGSPRARLGVDVQRSMTTPLVGRELDLLQLRTAFDRVARDNAVHMVTVAGEPGVGKSRLIAELATYVDELSELVYWRQGRCLPYGDGVTFWALGEIVKAHAGVLESDSPEQTADKLDVVLPDGTDRAWMRARLLPLLGLDTGETVSREESFTAWRRFIESLAESHPAVIVIEDLHWADPALLAFLEHVAAWVHGLPLLIVCATRPELFEEHPAWAAGLRNTMTITLSALSVDETATLVTLLLGRSVLPANTLQLVLDRAEGNPLWAEECVRILRDRGLLDDSGELLGDADVPFPQGIQALIAARLDTLSPDRKAMLADAAVIGRVFWTDALIAMGQRDPADVAHAMHELTGKELVRPSRDSSLAGQVELAFWHALVRDVAYGSIPRHARAAKHLAACHWLEHVAAGRVEDLAEVLAHHTIAALELAEASGDPQLAAKIKPLARRHALLAADKTAGLDAAQAMQLLDRALELTPQDSPDWPNVLARWARGVERVGRIRDAADALKAAATELRERGDLVAAADTLAQLGLALRNVGDPSAEGVLHEAVDLLETQPKGPELVRALTLLASTRMVAGAHREAISFAERALTLAEEQGLPVPGKAVSTLGSAKASLGDPAGLAELERALPLLLEAGQAEDAASGYNNLGVSRWLFEGPEAALATYSEGEEFARSRGLQRMGDALRASSLQALLETGRLAEVEALADEILPRLEAGSDVNAVEALALKARALLEQGRPAGAEAERVIVAARSVDPETLVLGVTAAAMARTVAGDHAGACELLIELADADLADSTEYPPRLPALVRTALAAGDADLATRLSSLCNDTLPVGRRACATASALIAQAAGEHARAIAEFTDLADSWAAFGNRLEAAYCLLAVATSATVIHVGDAEALLKATAAFAEIGAQPPYPAWPPSPATQALTS